LSGLKELVLPRKIKQKACKSNLTTAMILRMFVLYFVFCYENRNISKHFKIQNATKTVRIISFIYIYITLEHFF
jgi:hypothetical protein